MPCVTQEHLPINALFIVLNGVVDKPVLNQVCTAQVFVRGMFYTFNHQAVRNHLFSIIGMSAFCTRFLRFPINSPLNLSLLVLTHIKVQLLCSQVQKQTKEKHGG